MSWLAWAIDDPAPADYCGYSLLNVPGELADPSLRRGQVVHSVEGWFTYTSPSAVMRARGSSWGVTIMRSGQVWRHRPRPTFVNWHAGGPAQNIGTDGIEMEGKNQPWTPEQKASLLRVLKETWEWFGWADVTLGHPTDRTQEGIRRALLAGSLWEHRWFDYTSCPSGRDDWGWLMPALQEGEQEDDMEPELGKVSPPSATDLKGLPGEFAGKWPTWNIGGFIRYGFKLLRRRDNLIAANKAAADAKVVALGARVKTLERLKNPCNFGTDHATVGERMGQYRTAIKALQEAVAELKADSGDGLSADEARAIAQEEDAKLKVTK